MRKIIKQTKDFTIYDDSDDYFYRETTEYKEIQTRIYNNESVRFNKMVIEEINGVFGFDTYAFLYLNDELIKTF